MTKVLVIVAIILFGTQPIVVTTASPGPPEGSTPETHGGQSRIDRLIDDLEQELLPYADDPALDSLSVFEAAISDFELVILADENPTISDECYMLVLRHAALEMMSAHPELTPREAIQRGREHVIEMRKKAAREGRTYGEFFRHVVECTEWCKPLVVGLEKCHIESVAMLGPWTVFFDLDSSDPGTDVDIYLENVAAELTRDEHARVLLVGRASRIGDKVYNRALSRRRTEAVESELLARGIARERIHAMWLGWEPPQISASVAAAYGIGDVYAGRGRIATNQSVVIVIF